MNLIYNFKSTNKLLLHTVIYSSVMHVKKRPQPPLHIKCSLYWIEDNPRNLSLLQQCSILICLLFLVSILIQSFCYSNSSQLILDLKLSYCVISFKKMRLSKVENIDRSMLVPGPITSLRFLPDCFSFHHLSPNLSFT